MTLNYKCFSCNDINLVLMDLAKKAISLKRKVLIILDSKERLEVISIKFWNSRTFLPHGTIFDQDYEKYQHRQYIFLIDQENLTHIKESFNIYTNRIYVNYDPIKTDPMKFDPVKIENCIFLFDSMDFSQGLEVKPWNTSAGG